jgi:hypothetical protein
MSLYSDPEQTWPDTTEQALRRCLKELQRGLEHLKSYLPESDDDERREFRRAAVAGAESYIDYLTQRIQRDRVSYIELEKAELVSKAAYGVGWVSASAIDGLPTSATAMQGLIRAGVFAFYPQVPGRWIACYRLIDPEAADPS